MSTEESDQVVQRRANLEALKQLGVDPYPKRFTGHVRVELENGRVLEETQDAPRGGPEHPLAPEELHAKFRANAARSLPAARIEPLLDALLALDRADDVAPIAAALRRAT